MISIHAPLTGCDLIVIALPVLYTVISIHAPLTGCDPKMEQVEKD